MPTLYLVRHAEPTLTGVLLGWLDPPLSTTGREQATRVLSKPAEMAIVYASPLRRSLETAERISPLKPVVLEELKEIGYGKWDGRSWPDIEASDPNLALRKQADWRGVTSPGGEPWSDFFQRVEMAAARIRRGPLPAVIVAHAAVNAVLTELFTGADPLAFHQAYGEVHTIEF